MPELRALAVALAVLGSVTGIPVAADEDGRRAPGDFHRRAPVDPDGLEAGRAYAIPLSDAVVSSLAEKPELRLFDVEGREIPSVLEGGRSRVEVVDHPTTVFNRTGDEAGGQRLSVEVAEPRPEWIDRFAFEIDEPSYHLRVRVEASDDGESWQTLAERRHLLRYRVREQDVDYLHDELSVPRSRFRYYRFGLERLVPGSETPPREPIAIEAVRVREAVPREAPREVPVSVATLDDPRDDDPRHDYWRVDLGQEGLGVDRVALEIADREYARSASLWEWSEERQRRVRRLASTVVFEFGEDANTRLDGFSTDARYLVVMIDQGDDDPVELDAVRASRPAQWLRFLAPDPVLPLALHLDPDRARRPRYDLDRRLRERGIDHFAVVAHGTLEPNPDYREAPEPRSERMPYLLWLLVVPLVLGLAIYVARTLRRGLPDETPPSGS